MPLPSLLPRRGLVRGVARTLVLGTLFAASTFARGPGEDEADALRNFLKVCKQYRGEANEVYSVEKAIRELAGFDSPAVAEALLQVFDDLEDAAAPVEKRRRAAIDHSKGGDVVGWRRDLDPIRDLEQRIRERIETLRQPATVRWLVEHVLVDDDRPLTLRLVVARSAELLGVEVVESLSKVLASSRAPSSKVVVLETLARLGLDARLAGPAVLAQLGDDDAVVREKCAAAIARLGLPGGLEPLIERLAVEKGRTQRRMAIALEVLTGQSHGLSVDAWRRWFAAEGGPYAAGGIPLGQGESRLEAPTEHGYFHGIPQDGQSIVYVIDVSGSMVVSMANPVEGPDGRQPQPAAAGDPSRMDASKSELSRALGALPEGTLFDIVSYASEAKQYQPRMVEASERSVKKAQKFVEELEPFGATNIYDALESAFGLAGRGTLDRHYESQVDTIFLLTDGRPMLPDRSAQWDDTERILEGVRRWNPYKRVVVHCVGLGKNVNASFLRSLAEENGGVFVQR